MRGELAQKLRKLKIKISPSRTRLGYYLTLNKIVSYYEGLNIYSLVGTDKFKKEKVICGECGKSRFEKIEILREPTEKEKAKQDKDLIKMILDAFKEYLDGFQ